MTIKGLDLDNVKALEKLIPRRYDDEFIILWDVDFDTYDVTIKNVPIIVKCWNADGSGKSLMVELGGDPLWLTNYEEVIL